MTTPQPRGFKIDLQIRKRRQQLQSPALNKVKLQAGTTKSSNHSKKLNVTIHNKHEQKSGLPVAPEPQAKKIVISQFKVNDSLVSNSLVIPKGLNISAAGHSVRRQASTSRGKMHAQSSSSQEWWAQGQMMEALQKKNVISQIIKKEAQIQFYEQLLQQKARQCSYQAKGKQTQYEQYIQTLISLFQAEVEKHKQLTTDIENQEFLKKRHIINQQGRKGLNFSPKQLSTLSGMSAGSMLLDSIQRGDASELRKRRSQIFSFGSSSKLDRSRSIGKQARLGYFLNPGKTLGERGRKIFFE